MGILVNQNQIGGGASNSSHNIGDIFYTTRTDNSLNGAVECNGSQYNFSDFDSNLQTLFDEGKLPYLPIGKFDEMVTNQGGCDSFGYGTNELTLYPLELYQGSHYGTAYYSNVYDWEAIEPDPTEGYILHGVKIYDKDTHEELVGYTVKHHPLIGYDQWQLHNENDEYSSDIVSPSFSSGDPITLSNGGEFQSTTYFKVPKKLSRVLVRTQKPTADNNYTWYNVYADGWVEQGGNKSGIASADGVTVDLPISMSDNHYSNQTSISYSEDSTSVLTCRINSTKTTSTSFNVITTYANANSAGYGVYSFKWRLAGYADPAEYTKDKWNYQNIQVERCMVQLFNSTTDTAVATCNQVLADVSALNQGDYVIETQIPTPENNYSWYRLYKSGWVEQGGRNKSSSVSFPIEMADTNYLPLATPAIDTNLGSPRIFINNLTTTGMTVNYYSYSSQNGYWRLEGMSAQGKK